MTHNERDALEMGNAQAAIDSLEQRLAALGAGGGGEIGSRAPVDAQSSAAFGDYFRSGAASAEAELKAALAGIHRQLDALVLNLCELSA